MPVEEEPRDPPPQDAVGERPPPLVVVMGVAGAGKTTVGRGLAEALGVPFLDADDFHDAASVARMRAGEPLGDAEREPWLDRLGRELRRRAADTGAVLACSALTDAYRRRLTAGLGEVAFVLLTGSPEVIRRRLAARTGHFAGPALLPSQLATLQVPRGAVVLDVAPPVDEVVRAAIAGLARRGVTAMAPPA